MKTVKIMFPDGIRDWPANERIRASREIPPGPLRIEWVPKPDRYWRFQPVTGGWHAIRRY
ncbi:MAG TPA: hypothetical protein VMN38_11795 [Sphingomicrobium sp.]|nr:hypothetical protein [Sphingomicrobium sp.]